MFCQNDRNECIEGAGCFSMVNCTDHAAPMTGFTCDSCPPGFMGDGRTCDG